MSNGGIQQKLGRVRPPRVHITYEVETEGGIVLKELPFMLGVIGDYTGMVKEGKELPPLGKREFLEIDRDNFSDIMEGMNPHLDLRVKNVLDETTKEKLAVSLDFRNIEDFGPESVAEQFTACRELLNERKQLSNFLSKLDGNHRLSKEFTEITKNEAQMKEIQEDLSKRSREREGAGAGVEKAPNGGDA